MWRSSVAAEELECVVHGLVDLLDARAREALLGSSSARGLAGAEEAVAARVVVEALELVLDARARGAADARDLGAEEDEVERRERAEQRGAEGQRLPRRPEW